MTDQNAEIPKDFRDWREARRFRAWALHLKGWTQARIAEALGVTEGAISQWFKKVREKGLQSLRSRKGGGPKPKITSEQLESLPELLAKGPETYGFRGDVWTRARVGAVIEKEFGVSYSEVHVGRLLGEIGWTRQKPTERASQRDEVEIARWNEETWPEIKRRPLTKGESSFL
jgi:transposase